MNMRGQVEMFAVENRFLGEKMIFECAQIVLNASDVSKAKEFYINKMGLEILEEHPKSFAFRAGSVRYTVTPGGKALTEQDPANASVIFGTTAIEIAVRTLKERGIEFSGEISEAPGFMKFVSFADPDNNQLMLGQYLRDPRIVNPEISSRAIS